jgi:hypothetical protein
MSFANCGGMRKPPSVPESSEPKVVGAAALKRPCSSISPNARRGSMRPPERCASAPAITTRANSPKALKPIFGSLAAFSVTCSAPSGSSARPSCASEATRSASSEMRASSASRCARSVAYSVCCSAVNWFSPAAELSSRMRLTTTSFFFCSARIWLEVTTAAPGRACARATPVSVHGSAASDSTRLCASGTASTAIATKAAASAMPTKSFFCMVTPGCGWFFLAVLPCRSSDRRGAARRSDGACALRGRARAARRPRPWRWRGRRRASPSARPAPGRGSRCDRRGLPSAHARRPGCGLRRSLRAPLSA